MNNFKYALIALVPLSILFSCHKKNEERTKLKFFKQYYSALDKGSEEKWDYTSDTIKVWFDDKKGKPSLRIKGKKSTGKWKEWDEEMHSSSHYDTIWYDQKENSIKGYFYENNDFYELIGKAPTKTLRTYWLNQNNKINEILIYWIPEENTTTGQHLKPIVEWAILNDSSEIEQLYPNNRLVPSKENAKRWKILLKKYKTHTNNGYK